MRNCQICAFSDHYLIFEHSGQHCVQKIAKKKKSNHLPLLFQKIKERKRNHRPFPTCCTKLQKSLHFRLEMRGTRTQCIDEHGIIGEYLYKVDQLTDLVQGSLGNLVCRIEVHARLSILRRKSPLHGLIWVCMFIDFEKKFPPARLFGSL